MLVSAYKTYILYRCTVASIAPTLTAERVCHVVPAPLQREPTRAGSHAWQAGTPEAAQGTHIVIRISCYHGTMET